MNAAHPTELVDQMRNPDVFTVEVGFIRDAHLLAKLRESGMLSKSEQEGAYRLLADQWRPIYQPRNWADATGQKAHLERV